MEVASVIKRSLIIHEDGDGSVALVCPGSCAWHRWQPVLALLTDLETKIIGEGEAAQKVFSEFTEWCEERSANLKYEIKTGKAEVENLKAATEIRDKEAADFVVDVKNLVDVLMQRTW